MDRSESRQVGDQVIFAHLLFSSFLPSPSIGSLASTELEVEMAMKTQTASQADVEDQEVRLYLRKGAAQYLAEQSSWSCSRMAMPCTNQELPLFSYRSGFPGSISQPVDLPCIPRLNRLS
jgi:hypothetical protein